MGDVRESYIPGDITRLLQTISVPSRIHSSISLVGMSWEALTGCIM